MFMNFSQVCAIVNSVEKLCEKGIFKMKHIFVVNPTAGEGSLQKILEEQLQKFAGTKEYEIYATKGPGDATLFVRNYVSAHPEESLRFYACGGDGSINEVATGLVGAKNASMSVYACGSGNDYIKYYGTKEDFLDLPSLLDGVETPIDLMKVGDRYSVNVTNFGFDTRVAQVGNVLKGKLGAKAYTVGVVAALFSAMWTKCRIWADGEEICPKKLLLCSVANGRYVGGQYKCAPKGSNDDGLLEVCIIKCISHFKFVSLLGPYTKGEHLDMDKFKKIIVYRQAKKVHIESPAPLRFSLDGEILALQNFDIEVVPSAIRFAVPAKLAKTFVKEEEHAAL